METPLIPRKLLFGNPDKTMVQISPDGAWISWLAPREGVLNVWVAPRDQLEAAKPVTADTGRGIRFYGWAQTSQDIFFIQDKGGDENWRLYLVRLSSAEIRDLTPFEGVQAQVLMISPKHPQEILVAINNRDPQWHDPYRLNLQSGELSRIEENNSFADYTANDENELVLATQMTSDGSLLVYRKQPAGWQPWQTFPQEDALSTAFAGFDASNRQVFVKQSRGRDTAALYAVDLETKEERLLAEDSRVDAGDVVQHPTRKHIQAVSFDYERMRWQVLDPEFQTELDSLSVLGDGHLSISSRSLDDRWWLVVQMTDTFPLRYYLYDRQQRAATFLFTNRPALEDAPLTRMHPAVFPSRDGLDLVGYYSLPPGADSRVAGLPDQPLPMVLMPHGGPWGRDHWGFDTWHQWLANRGYAVMYVNFRASAGFGKAFLNAGDREWGAKVIEDQFDAVQWAIAQGIADPEKVAVMGGSFGGYSTLAGLTFFPELFVCGVDIVGPSNLVTLIESIPPYWKPMLKMFTTRIGDPQTEEGLALLKQHSPLTHVERICRPLLIAQGANDPRVKQAESDQIVQAMQARGIPVTYLLYPDEGHGFARPENNLSFYAVAEAFLAKCLGGRFEPVGEDFQGASIQVLAGEAGVPGLAEAL